MADVGVSSIQNGLRVKEDDKRKEVPLQHHDSSNMTMIL